MRTTLKAMVGVGLGLWLLALALPGYNLALLLFAAVLVAWSVFHLLTDGALIREQSADAGQSVWQVRGK